MRVFRDGNQFLVTEFLRPSFSAWRVTKLLVAYDPTIFDRPRFDFYGIARRSVPKIVGREMDKATARALQSAK